MVPLRCIVICIGAHSSLLSTTFEFAAKYNWVDHSVSI